MPQDGIGADVRVLGLPDEAGGRATADLSAAHRAGALWPVRQAAVGGGVPAVHRLPRREQGDRR